MDNRILTISTGINRKDTHWKQQTLTVSELFEKLKIPVHGTETHAAYLTLKKAQQDDLKDVGGYMAGSLSGERRKANAVTGRDVITLDFDNIPANGTDGIVSRCDELGRVYCVYSTRKHAPNAQRLRILIPTDRTMTPDEYEPCARYVAAIIGIEKADPTTFEVSRLMYWPSCCSDGEYIYRARIDKALLSVDETLGHYKDWRDYTEWPQVPGIIPEWRQGAKQIDPEGKRGVVGAFCRVYNVFRAMDELIPGAYEAADNSADRFTYTGGSTTGGAVVYDEGKFLFSHHATDPCSGRLVNAFDLVRLHKFSDRDDSTSADTPTNRLPSYTAMCEYAGSLKDVAALMAEERYKEATADFADISAEAAATPINWMLYLKSSPAGGYAKSISNISVVLEYDPLLKGRITCDTFADKTHGCAPLPWGSRRSLPNGTAFGWDDADDAGLRKYIENLLGFDQPGKLDAALMDHIARNSFNPVCDYLNGLQGQWDGTPRLDTLFIDYLGAEDSPYTRTVTRKAFVAAVARAMTPGCKYDCMLILSGPQGIGKSTILDKMSRGFFNDSIRTFEGKEASELLQGVWIVEIAELDAFRSSDVQRIKQFLSIRADVYRKAYGHRAGEHPRSCVFFGTTNNNEYLQDMTGNRRFWPVDVGLKMPTKSVFKDLDGEIDQIWAEAYARWQVGETLYLSGEIERQAIETQEEHRERNALEGQIADFLDQQIPSDWDRWSTDKRLCFWDNMAHGEYILKPRVFVCAAEIWCELMRRPKVDLLVDRRQGREIAAILRKLGWRLVPTPRKTGAYGSQRCFTHDVDMA